MWDTLETKYRVSNTGSELYVMEQFHDYRMVDGRSIVEQTHEIHILVKEFENFGCTLPEKFVVDCIITKLTQTWTDFAASLKHKRQEFGISNLIGSLDVEEKARAKDVCDKKVDEGTSSTHVVQKNLQNSHKNKFKQELKHKNTTHFKKKEKGKCFTCVKNGHYSRECLDAKWKPNKKFANVIEADGGILGSGEVPPC